MRLRLLAAPTLAAAVLAPSLTAAPAHAGGEGEPAFTSGHGITVTGVDRLSELTYRVRMTSAAVTAPDQVIAPDKQLSALVHLPASYASQPTRRYPTLYFLHGRSASALYLRDVLDSATLAGKDVITVAPEGGQGSWYTNWVNQPRGSAQWETFHIGQLLPWVDDNLRTLADKQHRAVAGISMGGYGATHYATKHPGLFNHVSTYSGVIDTRLPGAMTAVRTTPAARGFTLAPFDGTGPFGGALSAAWWRENPLSRVSALRGMNVSVYAGDGHSPDPSTAISELVARSSSSVLARSLRAQGMNPHVDLYGHDESYGGYRCNGGHTDSCFRMAFAKDIDRIMNSIG